MQSKTHQSPFTSSFFHFSSFTRDGILPETDMFIGMHASSVSIHYIYIFILANLFIAIIPFRLILIKKFQRQNQLL